MPRDLREDMYPPDWPAARIGRLAMEKDPVCLMDIDEGEAKAKGLTTEWHGQSQVFCSEQCKEEFDDSPELYASEPREFEYGEEGDYPY